jgi:hypothetical protein
MNKKDQHKKLGLDVSLIMASHSVTDGGCIYIEKQTKFLFGEVNFFVLSSAHVVLGFATRFFLGRVLTKIRRLGLFIFFFKAFRNVLVSCHARRFLADFRYCDTQTIVCVSEDIISLAVASYIKKIKPNITIHFSMLDLPWSYNAKNSYKQRLRRDFIQLFTENVDTADFTTKEMASIFHEKGFVGPSLVTYSAIDVIDYDSCRPKEVEPIIKEAMVEKSNFVYLGNLRATKELSQFCNTLKFFKESGAQDYELDLYGSSNFVHSNVNYFGFISPKDLNNILQDYSFGLVPMSFDEDNSELVLTSFPSKTWAYLTNGITPIIMAPASSGVAKLVNEYSIGVVISDIGDISTTLEGLNWEEEYKKAMANYKNFHVSLSQNFKLFREGLSR